METARVGKVAVENTAYHFDKAYDYLIPQTLWAKAEKGCRVLVPFGGGNRTRQGLLMDVEEIRAGRTGSEEGLKSVKAVLDQTPLLSPEMLLLARWMKERYFCTLFDAVRVMLPAGLHYQVACSYQAARDIPPEKLEALGDEEKRLIAYLSRSEGGFFPAANGGSRLGQGGVLFHRRYRRCGGRSGEKRSCLLLRK